MPWALHRIHYACLPVYFIFVSMVHESIITLLLYYTFRLVCTRKFEKFLFDNFQNDWKGIQEADVWICVKQTNKLLTYEPIGKVSRADENWLSPIDKKPMKLIINKKLQRITAVNGDSIVAQSVVRNYLFPALVDVNANWRASEQALPDR